MQDPHEKQRYQELARRRGLPDAYTAAVQQYMQRNSTTAEKRIQSRSEPTRSSNAHAIRFPNGREGIRGCFTGAKPIPNYAELLHWWFESARRSMEVPKVSKSLSHHGFSGSDGLHRRRLRIAGQIIRSMPQADQRLVRSVSGIRSHSWDVPYDRKYGWLFSWLIFDHDLEA
jgi:hypothetical protein